MSANRTPRQRTVWLLVAALLLAAGPILAWLGPADPPIDVRNSAFWYRTLQKFPGLTDVCGDFTWLARAIPPVVAALGALVALLQLPQSVVSVGATALGLALAAALAFATTQNAIPWGQLHCIID